MIRVPQRRRGIRRRSLSRPPTARSNALQEGRANLERQRHRNRRARRSARDLKRKGHLATVLSLVGILAYIAFRFRFSFAVGAVVATIHDLLVTLAFLAFFRYDLSLNVIAAS